MRTAALLSSLLAFSSAPEPPGNLLRNGSFEGGLLYWHHIDPEKHRLVREGARVGAYALRIEKGYVVSAPFVTRRGDMVTVSLWARGEGDGEIRVQMPPSAREEGQRAKRLWCREGTQTAKVTREWRRISFTWPADVPPSTFWPDPHYLIHIETNDRTPLLVDGVTVTLGDRGTDDYLPRRPVEIVADCPDLPGYEGAKGNLLERGATVRLTAHVSNPGPRPREVTVRWQFVDYEGIRPLGAPVEKNVLLPPAGTASETVSMSLPAAGTVLARLSALEGTTLLDSSDLPLTSLPYPKAATKPDWRERFGGSFAGGIGCVEKFQRLGFGWIRWRPTLSGEAHLPRDPQGGPWEWRWFDRELDEQEAHGCSAHAVLYPPPKWIMEKDHPLPKDMRWPADDPRWDDLSIETVWDRFVKGAVEHYRGRSLIYEIENEPEFTGWAQKGLLGEYAKFTIRTARLIKQVDPKAKVMVNNVYGIPSRVNAAFFKAGGLRFIDVMSWHDYHAGWLADAPTIRRMRQNLDEAGGKHVEIWFNEGWAFTNTAVDEPPACTGLTSVQSTHAIVNSVVELTAHGQEKTILFHTAYERHGMSFWDYSGPGTMLWDWYNFPLPLVAAWNVLNHHIGLSRVVGVVRPPEANVCIFQDLRNGRGVMIAYADRDAKSDVTMALPDFGAPLTAEDIMGNTSDAPRTLLLSKTGRPVLLTSAAKTAGTTFLEKLQPLDRRHQSFVGAGGTVYRLPASWEGVKKGSPEGNPVRVGDRPVWRIDRVYPDRIMLAENYSPVPWDGVTWHPLDRQQGGQPSVRVENGTARLSVSGPWKGVEFQKIAGIVFIAPEGGVWRVRGTASTRPWTGGAKTYRLAVMKKDTQRAVEMKAFDLPRDGTPVPLDVEVELSAGHELVFLPLMPDWHNGTTTTLEGLALERVR